MTLTFKTQITSFTKLVDLKENQYIKTYAEPRCTKMTWTLRPTFSIHKFQFECTCRIHEQWLKSTVSNVITFNCIAHRMHKLQVKLAYLI